jgi:hypothetical protein
VTSSIYHFLFAADAFQYLQQQRYQIKKIGKMTHRDDEEEERAMMDILKDVQCLRFSLTDCHSKHGFWSGTI